MAGLADLVVLAKQFGIFEFYLPFLILFSLFYGLLGKIKIFGNPFPSAEDVKKNTGATGEAKMAKTINLIFSLAASLFLMAYTPVGITLTQFFATSFTQTTIIITTLVSGAIIVYLLARLAGIDITAGGLGTKSLKYMFILGILIAVAIFISSGGIAIFPGLAGVDTSLSGIGLSMQDVMIIGLIVLTALAMYWVVHEKPESPPASGQNQAGSQRAS